MLPPTSYDGTSFYVPTPANVAATATGTGGSGATHAWKDGGSFSFHDVLDALNPLQHIPVVSSIYRWVTGDEPGNVARLAGDTLYGGPIGFAAGAFSIAFKEETGKDPGEMAVALVSGDHAQVTLGAAAAAAPAATTPSPAAIASTPTPSAATPTAAATPAAAPGAVPVSFGSGSMMPLFHAPGAPLPVTGGERAPPLTHPVTAPVPLQLTGPQLPQQAQRYRVTPAAPTAPGSGAPGAAAPQVVPPADLSALPQNPPIDIPQRMLDALDKYAHIQQQQQRGQQVDVAP
jgi:hypothetical protein